MGYWEDEGTKNRDLVYPEDTFLSDTSVRIAIKLSSTWTLCPGSFKSMIRSHIKQKRKQPLNALQLMIIKINCARPLQEMLNLPWRF